LGLRLSGRLRPQKPRPDVDMEKDRRGPLLSFARRETVQIEFDLEPPCPADRLAMSGANKDAIERKLDRLRSLGIEDSRLEWKRLCGGDAPRISRDLLALGVGYRLQEIEHGGLGKATRRKLRTMATALKTTGRIGPTPGLNLKPGARLIR